MFRQVLRAATPRLQSGLLSTALRGMSTVHRGHIPAKVSELAPAFKATAVVNESITNISLDDYKGKYVVLLFYPKDWTFVCPTEVIAFSERHKEFEDVNAQVIAASCDTEECHINWIRTPRSQGGLGKMNIPIIADVDKSIARDYNVLHRDHLPLRGLFIINPERVIESAIINDRAVGRSVDETLRIIKGFQFAAEHGVVCPANWEPGQKTMVADVDKSKDYFGEVYKQ